MAKEKERIALHGSWIEWLHLNMERKCDPEALLVTLLKENFSVASIRQQMGTLFPVGSSALKGLTDPAALATLEIDFGAIAAPRLTRPDSGLHVQQMLTNKLQIYTLDQFMSDNECAQLVAIINQNLRPSTITRQSEDKYFRTSSTCDLGLINDAFVKEIDERIARTMGITQGYAESIQAQHYEVGQEFKAHTDAFEPGTAEYDTFAGHRGQRTWTFMIYLDDTTKGGGTRFFAIDKIFYPRKGMAVIWNNLHHDGTPNADTLHSGMPVEQGHKVIITKWFRTRGVGPMFYDS